MACSRISIVRVNVTIVASNYRKARTTRITTISNVQMRVVQQSLLAYVKIVRNVTQECSKEMAERKYNNA